MSFGRKLFVIPLLVTVSDDNELLISRGLRGNWATVPFTTGMSEYEKTVVVPALVMFIIIVKFPLSVPLRNSV